MTQDVTFHVPESTGDFEMPARPGTYIAKLNRIERAAEDGQFGPQLHWFWELYNTYDSAKDLRPVAYQADGTTPWCYRETTSVKFGENPKSGVKAKARERAEALLKRSFEIGESLNASDLIGKAAVLHLIWKTSASDSTRQYLNVAHIEPYRAGYLAPLLPPEDVASGDDEGSLPF